MAFRVGGSFSLTVNGGIVVTGADATYQPSGEIRERIETGNGTLAYKARKVPGYIECTLVTTSQTDLRALNGLEDATVELRCGNGKVIRGTNCTRMGEPLTIDVAEGTTTLRVDGDVTDAS
jgi:hypothetical protein